MKIHSQWSIVLNYFLSARMGPELTIKLLSFQMLKCMHSTNTGSHGRKGSGKPFVSFWETGREELFRGNLEWLSYKGPSWATSPGR